MRGRHIALLVSLAVAVMTQAGPLVAADEQPAASEMPVSTSTPDVAAESPAPATVEAPGQGLTVLPMERIDRAEEKLAGRWRTIRRSPFAAHGAAGAWTGSELIVVDPLTGKTAGYDPDADRWSRYPTAPHVFAVEEANAWTDDELIVLAELGVIAFSPGERRWRRLPDHPIAALATSAVWTGEELIAVTGFGSMASYRPAEDHWAGRGNVPAPGSVWSLHWTGDVVLAVSRDRTSAGGGVSVSAYDPATGAWRHTDRIPLDAFVGPAVWTGDRLVFLTWGPDDSLANGAYDPTARTWTPWDLPCSTSARGTAWTGDLLISDDGKRALDPDAMTCHRVPAPPFRTLGGDVLAWTDEELISWSGIRALAERPRPRGIALRLQDPERT